MGCLEGGYVGRLCGVRSTGTIPRAGVQVSHDDSSSAHTALFLPAFVVMILAGAETQRQRRIEPGI